MISLNKVLSHAVIVLSGMLIVLLLIDRVNSAMNFINNDITKALTGILCVLSIVNSIRLLTRRKKRKAKQM